MRKKKILFVKIVNRNLGDSVIAGCSEYLLRKALGPFYALKYDIIPYDIASQDLGAIRYVDAIVFHGGGLIKFLREKFYQYVAEIVEEANRQDVPVFFCGVGVEGYNEDDERCLLLRKALNFPCVKGIAVRDDIDTLRNKYMDRADCRIMPVFDPAVWTNKAYSSSASKKREKTVGLGVARAKLFTDYGIEKIDHDFLLEFWKEVALSVEKQGYNWEIFTNGLTSDEEFAEELIDYIGHGTKLPVPTEDKHLISYITSFSGVIACRMHTNIIAYSFGIPSIGLVWNNKLSMWGEKIGYADRFVEPEKMKPEYVVDLFKAAIIDGCRKPTDEMYLPIFQELKWFTETYIKNAKASRERLCIDGDKLFAVALGSRNGQYDNMNSLQVLRNSWHDGFRCFETDIRLTSDDRLVCVNGWNEKTNKALGVKQDDTKVALSYDEFVKRKYYGRYETLDFNDLIRVIGVLSDGRFVLILDPGKPDEDSLGRMICEITDLIRYQGLDTDCFIWRTQRKCDVRLIRKKMPKANVAFQIPSDDWLAEHGETFDDRLAFAVEKGCRYVLLNHSQFTEEHAKLCNNRNLRVIIQKANRMDEIEADLRNGAWLIGTNRTSPALIKKYKRK